MKAIGRGLHMQVLTGWGHGMKVERFLKAIGTATADGSNTTTVGIAIATATSATIGTTATGISKNLSVAPAGIGPGSLLIHDAVRDLSG